MGRMISMNDLLLPVWVLLFPAGSQGPEGPWSNGPPRDPSFFPLGVWLQDPANAPRYRAAGINLFVGLWRGPTGAQLSALKAAGMKVICHQNESGLSHPDRDVIVGWMHGDEPDNAQPRARGGYGPPLPPQTIIADYEKLRAKDPTRPVLLNLGQGVAWDNWIGRGVRCNHPEDYPEYVKGCDIVSFDIYPVVHDHPEVAGKLWRVPFGVERLRQWTKDQKIVWNCIEASRIDNPRVKPTPAQIRSEVWMSLIRGSRGIIYFVHQFRPRFLEASLLEDAELLRGVTAINREILELAPVLNSPTVLDGVEVKSSNPDVPVAGLVKRLGKTPYLFAAALRDGATKASFTLKGLPSPVPVEVLGEGRRLTAAGGRFEDDFKAYEVHLYRFERKDGP